jgi:hypothetical protein
MLLRDRDHAEWFEQHRRRSARVEARRHVQGGTEQFRA